MSFLNCKSELCKMLLYNFNKAVDSGAESPGEVLIKFPFSAVK